MNTREGTVAKRQSKSDLVHSVIKEAIINGELKPGTHLVMADLAAKLGVSVQPVREALKRLDTEGYVTWTLNVGAVVSEISITDIKEDIPILRVLEGLATREAAQRMAPPVLAELERMLTVMHSYVEKEKHTEYGLLNKEFHRLIHKWSGNSHLLKILDELWARRDRLRAVFLLSPTRAQESLREHEAVVAALKAGQGEKAAQIIEEHRMNAAEELLKHLDHSGSRNLLRSAKKAILN
ncbi:MAG: GntR family transcriptional regulator [Firmicutes bacterium]|nr:GntR family transcriptional regulator [Bacillota bacterium]